MKAYIIYGALGLLLTLMATTGTLWHLYGVEKEKRIEATRMMEEARLDASTQRSRADVLQEAMVLAVKVREEASRALLEAEAKRAKAKEELRSFKDKLDQTEEMAEKWKLLLDSF